MSEQSGFLSNRYAYEPFRNEDGVWKEIGSTIGSALGQALTSELGPIGQTFGDKGGDFVGSSLGNAIDNASTIESNVNTFLSEINDWRSWADVMSSWGGFSGWSAP